MLEWWSKRMEEEINPTLLGKSKKVMGKMKELFIEAIEANAAYITFDTKDELKHIDDEYHYSKYKKEIDEEEELFQILTQTGSY